MVFPGANSPRAHRIGSKGVCAVREYSEDERKVLARVLPSLAQELRGAMANIHAAVDRLAPVEARERDPAIDQTAAVFTQSFFRVNRLLGNLDDAADLATEGMFMRLGNDDIVGLTRSVCEQCEALFADEGVTLLFKSDRAGQVIAMDAGRIKRLLFNLLSNALKFTPKGGTVTVRIRVTERSVLLTVSDTGRGIEPKHLEHVFDNFLEGDPLRLPPRGIGLGLALCRRIAEGHGGSIVAASKPGKGARFTVSLPNRHSQLLRVREPATEYGGGFNRAMVELSDGLSLSAFTCRHLD